MSWEPDRKVRRCQEDYDAGFRAAIAGLDKTVPPEIDTWDFVRRNAWLIGWSDGHTHMRCTSNLSVCVVPECGEPVAERGACEGQWCPEHWAEHTREYPACAALYWAAVKASEW